VLPQLCSFRHPERWSSKRAIRLAHKHPLLPPLQCHSESRPSVTKVSKPAGIAATSLQTLLSPSPWLIPSPACRAQQYIFLSELQKRFIRRSISAGAKKCSPVTIVPFNKSPLPVGNSSGTRSSVVLPAPMRPVIAVKLPRRASIHASDPRPVSGVTSKSGCKPSAHAGNRSLARLLHGRQF